MSESTGAVRYIDVDEVAGALRVSVGMLVRRLKQTDPNGELTLPETSALSRLDRGGPATSSDLARLERISPQSVGVTIAGLEQRGLIARQRDPQDRRRHVVSITAAGGIELLRLRAMVQALEDEFFAPLSAADRAVLHELLTRLAARHDPSCCPLSEPD